ncbi:MAG: cytoskeletal protein CcmA (bactofilin family) [Bacteroidia bacterium]|jgi:cytoskeletal protein CcmA (bactofilin family)
MLSSKKKENNNASAAPFNVIGVDTIIEGNIISKGDVRIDGTLVGSIKTAAKLVLGTSGKIEGDIDVKSADVSGTVKGNVVVSEILFLKQSAKIHGDIKTGKLVVDSGGEFNGSCTMSGNTIPMAGRSTTSASSATDEAAAK